jgi:hypothetical protein
MSADHLEHGRLYLLARWRPLMGAVFPGQGRFRFTADPG